MFRADSNHVKRGARQTIQPYQTIHGKTTHVRYVRELMLICTRGDSMTADDKPKICNTCAHDKEDFGYEYCNVCKHGTISRYKRVKV